MDQDHKIMCNTHPYWIFLEFFNQLHYDNGDLAHTSIGCCPGAHLQSLLIEWLENGVRGKLYTGCWKWWVVLCSEGVNTAKHV